MLLGQRSVDGMIKTEKNFADTSLLVSTKKAFIKYIDPEGIVFDKGKPVNGYEFYKNHDRITGILTWEPEYAEISSSNDFGYTTGPWKYYENTPKENPIAQGQFITVWHITNDGSWKFLIDFGISYSKQAHKTSLQKVYTKNIKSKNKEEQTLRESEEDFIEAYYKKGAKAYKDFLSENSRLNYKDFLPAITSNQRKNLLDSLPGNIQYTIAGSGESPNHDLGYVYGTEKINDKEDGYLRIWRKEKEDWKIAVEVLHFK
jgi:ketosteroid isomerase-like protein